VLTKKSNCPLTGKLSWSRIEKLRIENAGGSVVYGYEIGHAHAVRLIECDG